MCVLTLLVGRIIIMNTDKWPNGDVMTPEQIKKKWEGYGNYARNQGTWMHYNIERYFNGLVSMDL